MALQIKLKIDQIVSKVTNDGIGTYAAQDWKRLIDDYTPHESGELKRNVKIRPFEIHYKQPYAHYQYTGEVYIDPLYKVGGFFDPTYGWYSRWKIDKIPSGRSFKHHNANTNPLAIDHWDDAAEKAGRKEELYRDINNKLRRKGQ